MVRRTYLPAVLAGSLLSVVAVATRAAPPAVRSPSMQAQIDTHFESGGIFRNRVSASVDSSIGPLSAFLVEDCAGAKLSYPVAGLATPPIDLGPLRERGLIRELNHPFGLGSIREPSGVTLDRSVATAVSPGGVVRLGSSAPAGRRVEFYAFRRGGAAPPATNTGGVTCSFSLPASIDVELAAKMTSFGPQEPPEKWLSERPAVSLPVVVKGGARLSGRLRAMRANLSSGVALSDRLRPAAFCSGFIGFSKSLRVVAGRAPRALPLFLSARLDGGVTDPNYYGDDGRFVLKTALVHSVFSLRLPGLRAGGGYGYTVYRLPLLPAQNRRTVHGGEMSLVVEFGLLSIGSGWQPRLEYAEDGRILFRELSTLNAELLLGVLALRGEIGFRHSNESADEIEAGFSLTAGGTRAKVACAAELRDGSWSVGTDATIPQGLGSLQIGLTVADLSSLCRPRTSSGPFDRWGEAVGHSELTISWRARSS